MICYGVNEVEVFSCDSVTFYIHRDNLRFYWYGDWISKSVLEISFFVARFVEISSCGSLKVHLENIFSFGT